MQEIRMVLYAVGVLMSGVLAGQLFRIRHPLARLLAAAMVAWAFNCITLVVLLYFMVVGGECPAWRDLLITINAVLLAAMPIILYAWFLKENQLHG